MHSIEHVAIGRRWLSSEIDCVEGPLHLRAWRGTDPRGSWYANAYLSVPVDGKFVHASHSIEAPRLAFPSHLAAIAALNAWADALGPVEPWLALFGFFRFARRPLYERWAHRGAEFAEARRMDMGALAYDLGVEREGRAA